MHRMTVATIYVGLSMSLLAEVGCQSTGVGDPCTPEAEYDRTFFGYSATEVSVESKSFQCQSRLCLVDHFQGRVSCPYGQQADGGGYPGAQPCTFPGLPLTLPDGGQPYRVDGIDPTTGQPVNVVNGSAVASVLPQCTNRRAADAVYCSCRCANVNGQTNDGYNYCKCPDGFTCTQLIGSIGPQSQGLTGAYCVKNGAQFQSTSCTSNSFCQADAGNCGSAQGVHGH